MPLVIIKSFLVPVKCYNKFNQGNVQKIDTESKTQDNCQRFTVTSGNTKAFFSETFAGFLKTQKK